MIIQKEAKYALGLTVILLFLGAAFFIYEGEEAQKLEGEQESAETSDELLVMDEGKEKKTDEGSVEKSETGDVDFTTIEVDFFATDTTADTDRGTAEEDVVFEFEEDTVVVATELPVFDASDTKEDEVSEGAIENIEYTDSSVSTVLGGEKYVIKKGDTFQGIAKKFYGTTLLWLKIANANRTIPETEMIPGQIIIIPEYKKVEKKPVIREDSEKEKKRISGVTYYTVRRGNTLEGISNRFYQDPNKWQQIMDANPSIRDEYKLYVGMEIIIPGIKPKPKEYPDIPDIDMLPDLDDLPSADSVYSTYKKIHIVKQGETLWSIAELYFNDGMKYKDILKANPGINKDRLYSGQKITVPGLAGGSKGVRRGAYYVYTVKEYDTLSEISDKLLGSSRRWREILFLNEDVLKGSARNLKPGIKLRIPDKDLSEGIDAIEEKTSFPDLSFESEDKRDQYLPSLQEGVGSFYTIRTGDTLGGISGKFYGTSKYWIKIIEANPGLNEYKLYVGNKIKIPYIKRTGKKETPAYSSNIRSYGGDDLEEIPVIEEPASSYLDTKSKDTKKKEKPKRRFAIDYFGK